MTNVVAKIPPHSIEAEQAVLGGLLLAGHAWDQIADRINVDDFYRSDHRNIFRAMGDLAQNDKPLDVITVAEFIEQGENPLPDSGLAYLGELAKNTPSAANIAAYADIVRERSILRNLIDVGTEITEVAYNPQGKVAREILDEAESKVFAIAEAGNKGTGPRIIADVLASAVERIEKLYESGSSITGCTTGFTDFDNMTSGLQPADLIVIAGRPSMGKTTFAINIAEHMAMTADNKHPVLVFSMEMPAESLAMRILASLGRIEQQKIRSGQLNDTQWPRLTSAISLMSSKKLLIDDSGSLSPVDVRARSRRVAREYGGIKAIIIDYLQLMKMSGRVENRTAEISEISRSLKALARELNVPVIALSQLNRGLEQRIDKRPVMSDLRESGAIEQDADLIVFIYRDEVYNKETTEKGVAEIIISKQRNGPIGVTKLTFLGQYSRFENYTAEMAPSYA